MQQKRSLNLPSVLRTRTAAYLAALLGLTACAAPVLGTALGSQAVASVELPTPADFETVPKAPEVPEVRIVELPGAPEAAEARTVRVDLTPFVGEARQIDVIYDVDAVTRSISRKDVRGLPAWAAGTRLLMGEVGLGRLRQSRWSVAEGVGILQTVKNRLDPERSNPLGVPGVASWPGCGPSDTFQTCIEPREYLGIATPQALKPTTQAEDDVLLDAIDRAVIAWHVFDAGYLGDVTGGATSFVHRCGGVAYGQPTTACDGRGRDTRGASPSTGPIVFKGPRRFVKSKGCYEMAVVKSIDYQPGPQPVEPNAYVDYLGLDGDGIAAIDGGTWDATM